MSEQSMAALAYGNKLRIRRSEIKKSLAAGELTVAELLELREPALDRALVVSVLEWIPRVGRQRAPALVKRAGLRPAAHWRYLSELDRSVLAALLERPGAIRGSA